MRFIQICQIARRFACNRLRCKVNLRVNTSRYAFISSTSRQFHHKHIHRQHGGGKMKSQIKHTKIVSTTMQLQQRQNVTVSKQMTTACVTRKHVNMYSASIPFQSSIATYQRMQKKRNFHQSNCIRDIPKNSSTHDDTKTQTATIEAEREKQDRVGGDGGDGDGGGPLKLANIALISLGLTVIVSWLWNKNNKIDDKSDKSAKLQFCTFLLKSITHYPEYTQNEASLVFGYQITKVIRIHKLSVVKDKHINIIINNKKVGKDSNDKIVSSITVDCDFVTQNGKYGRLFYDYKEMENSVNQKYFIQNWKMSLYQSSKCHIIEKEFVLKDSHVTFHK